MVTMKVRRSVLLSVMKWATQLVLSSELQSESLKETQWGWQMVLQTEPQLAQR